MNDVHETRRQAAWWALLGQAPEAAGFLVTSLVNIRYLTGFSGSNAALLLQPSGSLLCTDGRYVIQAGEQCPDLRLIVDRASASALCRVWGATAVGPLAIESDHVSVAALRGLQGMLAEVALEVSGVVEGCRAIKDDHEIAQIERACSISDLALHDILASVHVGDSERQIVSPGGRRGVIRHHHCRGTPLGEAPSRTHGPTDREGRSPAHGLRGRCLRLPRRHDAHLRRGGAHGLAT